MKKSHGWSLLQPPDVEQLMVELEFKEDTILGLEARLKTAMLSNLTLRKDIERLQLILADNNISDGQS